MLRSSWMGWKFSMEGRRGMLREVPHTWKPSLVSSFAVSRPMPTLAPVRKTFCTKGFLDRTRSRSESKNARSA